MACPAPIGVVASGVRTATWSHRSGWQMWGLTTIWWEKSWENGVKSEDGLILTKTRHLIGHLMRIYGMYWNVGASQLAACSILAAGLGCVFLSYPILPPKLF